MLDKQRKQIKPGTVSSLPVALSTGSDRKWCRVARLRNGSVVCFLLCLVGSVSCSAIRLKDLSDLAVVLSFAWGGCIVFIFLFQALLEKHIWRTLQSRDASQLGCWIQHLLGRAGTDASTRKAQQLIAETRAALVEQLPLLTEETAFLLLPGDRNALYRTLYGRDTEIIAVVLQVVPILGDACAMRGVHHLADGKGAARVHPELKANAQSCLTRLQAVLALNNNSQGLLRASQPPSTPPEELLLPVQANNETNPKELLRTETRK